MKAASVNEIKQELKRVNPSKLVDLCLQLARFKNDNKQFLTYLLFEADDPEAYIKNVKEEMDHEFSEINVANLYYVKKSLRKILRHANKYIRYTGSKTAEAEILMHFLTNFKGLKINLKKSTQLSNMYAAQLKKINAALDAMHEDLQFEYRRELSRLEN
ncbi:MAG TPA: hypothetical protein VJT83_00590 [Chitinophagaceae bacterium]|nr:hypothetical protein [Chitinophagaceae bacterium]